MLLEGADMIIIDASTRMASYRLTYLKSKLGFYPFDLVASILLYLCLNGLRGFLSSFEAFDTRVVFLRELYNRGLSYRLFQTERK
jgi:hypothetical protein